MDTMKELYARVAKDSALKEKFNSIMNDAEKSGESATKDKLIAFAKEAGYTVSFEEVLAFFMELDQKGGELSEAELDSVAGGKNSDEIAHSITSLGSYCAAVSIKYEATGRNCGDRFS